MAVLFFMFSYFSLSLLRREIDSSVNAGSHDIDTIPYTIPHNAFISRNVPVVKRCSKREMRRTQCRSISLIP